MDANIHIPENIYKELFDDLLNEEPMPAPSVPDPSIQEAIDAVMGVATTVPTKPLKKLPKIKIVDKSKNLLDPQIQEQFVKPLIVVNDEIFSSPLVTTVVLQGELKNLTIMEKDLLDDVEPLDDILAVKCNFGCKEAVGYKKVSKVKTSNRGRKKKPKTKKKQRKVQGKGDAFSSQITLVVRSDIIRNGGFKEFEPKIFRNGQVILPDANPESIGEVLKCMQKVVDYLNHLLNYDVPEDYPLIFLSYMVPVMINYKFHLKLERRQFIDLAMLKNILIVEKCIDQSIDLNHPDDVAALFPKKKKKTQKAKDAEKYRTDFIEFDFIQNLLSYKGRQKPPHPPIFDVKYTREDTKLCLKFLTPIPNKPEKCTCISIFPGNALYPGANEFGGKVNIQGALEEKTTREIFVYLMDLFETFYDYLVVQPDDTEQYIVEDPRDKPNIYIHDIEAICREALLLDDPPMILEGLTETDATEILQFLEECGEQLLSASNTLLNDLFLD
jgi:hypothetical protein